MTSDDCFGRFTAPEVDRHLLLAAQNILRARRAFRSVLPPDILYDPALEILLILYLAAGGRMRESELLAAGQTFGITERWIAALAKLDLLINHSGEVRLSQQGWTTVSEGLERVLDAQMIAD